MKYNGWTNYETWIVALWIDNDHQYWRERAAKYKDRPGILADKLRESLSEHELEGMHADLLNAALNRVNWQEIASHLLED